MTGLVILLALGSLFVPWRGCWLAVSRGWQWIARDRSPRPSCRPIEQVARDARRLGRTFRNEPRGISFVKYEAHRRAYDDVLTEGCRALQVEHLLTVLAPGPELDTERHRVEGVLEMAGLELGLPLV